MTLRHHDIEALFEIAERSVKNVTAALSARIQNAAAEQDFETVAALTKSAATIASYANGIAEEKERLGLAGNEREARTFLIRITEGALRNSYLSVTEGMKKGWLKPGETVRITLAGGREFATLIMLAKRLQERGLISEFYSDQEILAGDYVEMTETEQGSWTLAPVNFRKKEKNMLNGEYLNEKYKLGAVQAKYRENGVWYHSLNEFPGALFDARGYVLFDSAAEYEACDQVKKGPDPNHIHVKGGISSLPFYVPLEPPPLESKGY
jgi:hypothetical protein